MKKTFTALMCLVGVVQATAATVNTEETYQGGPISHSPTNQDAFAVTFEVDNISLEDIASTTPFFTWEMHYSENQAITVQALYGTNSMWSFYIGGSLGNYIAQSQAANTDDASGTYIFQFEEGDSGYFMSFGKLDIWGDITPLVTTNDSLLGQPFNDVYSGSYSGSTMTEGSFTINTVNASAPVIKNVKSWDGTPTGEEIVEANKAVPEPATATLSLLALAGLAARRRRR